MHSSQRQTAFYRAAMLFTSLALGLLCACASPEMGDPITDAPVEASAGIEVNESSQNELVATDCNASPLPSSADAGRWDPSFTIPGLMGQYGITPFVYDLARDPAGQMLAVGSFEFAGQKRVGPATRLRSGVWEPLRTSWNLPLPPSGFSAMALGPQNELALATHDDFGPRAGQVWFDTGSGVRVIGNFSGLVRSLVFFGGKLWMAGDFTLNEGGVSGLAIWNGTAWSAPPGGAADGAVYELYRETNSLFIAGRFQRIGGIAAQKVAEWNGSTWKAYSLPSGLFVSALARGPAGELVAGGALPVDGNQTVGSIYRWTGSSWALLGNGVSSGSFAGVVTRLLPFQGKLVVAGCFSHVNGAPESSASVRALSLASWTGSRWESLDNGTSAVAQTYFNPAACGDEGPYALWDVQYQRLLSDGARLWVGGSFPGVAGVASQSLISFDGRSFRSEGQAKWGLSGSLENITEGGPECRPHALGSVTHAGTTRVARTVLQFNNGWTALGSALPSTVDCRALAVGASGKTYVGCIDREPDPVTQRQAGRVYELRSGRWVSIGGALPPVNDLAFDRTGRLWAVGGEQTGYVGRLADNNIFTTVDSTFNGPIFRLDFAPTAAAGTAGELLVGGAFTQRGTQVLNRIARWNGSRWFALGSGLSSFVLAIEYGSQGIYASTLDEGTGSRFVLGKWNGTAWTELATPQAGISNAADVSFSTLLERGGRLIAGGSGELDDGSAGVFLYDGTRFRGLGGGLNAIFVEAVAVDKGSVWVAGGVTAVGSEGSRVPSLGVARFQRNL